MCHAIKDIYGYDQHSILQILCTYRVGFSQSAECPGAFCTSVVDAEFEVMDLHDVNSHQTFSSPALPAQNET